MKDILIIRPDILLKPSTMHDIREGIKEQIKEGVVVLPAYLKAELINVPDDIEVITEGLNEIQQEDDNQSD